MSCGAPVGSAALADYWLALLPEAEEARVEEHLFTCDACGDRLREIAALIDGVRRLARQGVPRLIVSPAYVQRAGDEGRRVREYAPAPGGSVQCTVSADDDLVIARLAADLRNVPRVDLTLSDAGGTEWARLADIPVRADAAEVVYQESMPFVKAAATQTMVARLIGVEADQRESVLAEYTFHHTRSLPGPGVRLGDTGPSER